jgi:glucan phosphoethanolaminetransferase (alkaline phosphatase superfamily)
MTITSRLEHGKSQIIGAITARFLPLFTAFFLVAMLALYVIDITVNLALGEKLIIGDPIVAGWKDFFGLLQAEAPVAFGCAIASMIAGAIIAKLLKRQCMEREATIVLSVVISTLTILSSTNSAWNFSSSQIPLAMVIAAIFGAPLWLLFRLIPRKSRNTWVGFQEILTIVVSPSLFLGLCSLSLARIVQHKSVETVVDVAWTILILVLLSISFLSRVPARRLTAAIVIAASSIPIAVLACFSTIPKLEASGVALPESQIDRPDIILIVLDTVRADHLMRYGYSRNTMPALDKWSASALVANRAVSPAGWTTPAHASILSGLPVSLHGVHYGPRNGPFTTTAFDAVPWLPQLLRQEGYYCLAISANPLAVPAEVKGFQHIISPSREMWVGATIAALLERYGRLHNPLSEWLRWRTPYADAKSIVDITMGAVPDGNAPVFLLVNFLDAHSPYNPPGEALALLGITPSRSIPRYLSHNELTQRWSALPAERQQIVSDLYDGELRWIDLQLERLLVWLNTRFGPDALVIITSDHGEELGEEERVGHEYGLSQKLIHVPLFIKGPSLMSGGIEDILSLRSLYEFILQYARGASPDIQALTLGDEFGVISERYPSGVNGKSLGREYERPWVALFEEGIKGVGPSSHGIQVVNVTISGFDQEIPVSDEEVVNGMSDKIDRFWKAYRDEMREEETELPSKEDQMRLRSLGYAD